MPEVRYETDRLEIAPEFDHPICAGTLDDLDEHVAEVSRSLGLPIGQGEPLRVYWMTDGVSEFCREGSQGCFFPGTRVLFARGGSIGHELVHALLDSGGETFFVEEGMAEVFSGAAASIDASGEGQPLNEGLSLTRADYRAGSLDYVRATHFVRWVYETRGFPAMLRLSREIRDDADGPRLRRAVEDIFEAPIDAVEAQYAVKAPGIYRGLYEAEVPVIHLGRARQGLERVLDCDARETRGPLWGDRAGMFRAERLVLPRSGDVRFELEGDGRDASVFVFDPHARRASTVTSWNLPDPAANPSALRLEAGESRTVSMTRGTYFVAYVSEDPTSPTHLELRIQLDSPDHPTTEHP